MRTFSSWEPLQDPEFQSLLDAFRRFNQGMGLTPDDVRESFPKPDFRRLDADAMAVAEKVARAVVTEGSGE